MIAVTEHGSVREIRLNRPPVNALSTELIAALREAIEKAPGEGVRALVVSGAPGMFSAGLDLPFLLGLDRAGVEGLWSELYALMKALAASPVPICAALTGHAPAGGTVIALFCDRRVAARGDFKLGISEVQVGIPVPPVILKALQRQVGARIAERLAVGGMILSPHDALALGLVDELATPDAVVESALAWCRNLVALPQDAMSKTRRRARADLITLFEEGREQEVRGVQESWWSAEAQSVLQAAVRRLAKSTK